MSDTPETAAHEAERMIFLCGADMHPLIARQRYPDGRFIEIARADRPLPGLDGFPDDANDLAAVWGILLRVSASRATSGSRIAVTLSSNLQTAALLGTTAADVADPAQVLAAVQYWELPGAYRQAVAFIAGDA